MDTTIRNIDEEAYQRLRTWAADKGLSMGEAFNRLVYDHVFLPRMPTRKVSFWDIQVEGWGPGTEDTSQRIDEIVYDEAQE